MSEKRRTRPPRPLARPVMGFERKAEEETEGLVGVVAPEEDGEYSPGWPRRAVRS